MRVLFATIHFASNAPIRCPLRKVFSAFSDIEKKRKWFAVSASTEAELYESNFEVGGSERARYRFGPDTPFPGESFGMEGIYLDIQENSRIVSASTMAMRGRPFSASLVTFEFKPNANGTELLTTHQGAFFEGSDGPTMREAGWEIILSQLDIAIAAMI